MPSLPTQRPKWYGLKDNEERGWTPLTSDIVDNPQNREIARAWALDNTYKTSKSEKATLKLDRLRILSPIQVGGYIMPEGGILPAQIGGVPCIPGSSLRGAFLHYLRQQWDSIDPEEQTFWQSLMLPERQGWQPRAIRFEIIWLNNLGPYPLNPQQKWQLFDTKENKLGVQWQVNPQPPGPSPDRFNLRVLIPQPINETAKKWLQQRLEEMLLKQGIGRGTHSGFGRLGNTIPEGTWQITLTGMKPAICAHQTQGGHIIQQGKYRWSPQVLKANLRSLFHRLALSQLSRNHAQRLTDIIFGSFNGPALLTITSLLHSSQTALGGTGGGANQYANIPRNVTRAIWNIKVDANPEFHTLVGQLLALASRIGGLGPAWRRPPHEINHNCYRGSQFTVTGFGQDDSQTITAVINAAIATVQDLAQQRGLTLTSPSPLPNGCIQSIWQGNSDQWKDIVHGVCSTNATNRPAWCGNNTSRPSGYSVRQYDNKSLITVFDPAVEASLRANNFARIWPI